MRSRSGMLVALECRMSFWVMTKIASAVRDNLCSFLATEVTSMFIRSSRFTFVRSGCVACPCAAWDARNRKKRTDPRIAYLPKTRRTAPSLLISLSCRSNTTTLSPSIALSARSRWKYSRQQLDQGAKGGSGGGPEPADYRHVCSAPPTGQARWSVRLIAARGGEAQVGAGGGTRDHSPAAAK